MRQPPFAEGALDGPGRSLLRRRDLHIFEEKKGWGLDFDDDLTACAGAVQRGDPERFAAVMAAPPGARGVLFALYAFNLEIARAPWLTQEAMIAEMRLQWWRDALEEIAARGLVRRHEVVTPLALVLDPEGARMLDRCVAARRRDVYRDAFGDEAALWAYLEDTGGVLMQVAARALGEDEGAARAVGTATALAMFLRAVPELEARGRVPLVDGRPEAVARLAREGLARMVPARGAAVLAGWQTRALLRQAVQEPQRVAQGGLQLSEFGRRWRLLRAGLTGRV